MSPCQPAETRSHWRDAKTKILRRAVLLNIYRSGFKAKDSAECKQKHCAHASAKVLLPSDVNILSTLQMFVRHLLSLSQCTPLYRYLSSVNPPSLKGFHHFHGSFLFLALTFLLFCLFLFTSLLSLKTSLLLLPSKNVFIVIYFIFIFLSLSFISFGEK